MFVGRRFGNNWFAGTSVGGIGCAVLVFGFIIIGTPVFIVMEVVRNLTPLGAIGWVIIAALGIAVIGGLWMLIKAGSGPGAGYMSPEERAEIMARYPDPDDEDEPVRLRKWARECRLHRRSPGPGCAGAVRRGQVRRAVPECRCGSGRYPATSHLGAHRRCGVHCEQSGKSERQDSRRGSRRNRQEVPTRPVGGTVDNPPASQ